MTLLALPALWWANKQSDAGAPNVATVGIEVADANDSGADADAAAVIAPVDARRDPDHDHAGRLDHADADHHPAGDRAAHRCSSRPERAARSAAPPIGIPASPTVATITTKATYRSTISPADTCLVAGIDTGTRITVTNLDNGHSVDCIANRVYTDGERRPRAAHQPVRPDRRPHRRADPGRDHVVTHSRPAIRELLESNHLAPRRDLGQNFVADPNTVRRIADLARVGPGDHVVEIGAGLGSLTLALADTGAAVTAVEVDRGIVPLLRDVVADRANVTSWRPMRWRLDWNALLDPAVEPAGCSSPTCPTTWRRRSSATCSTACRRSAG